MTAPSRPVLRGTLFWLACALTTIGLGLESAHVLAGACMAFVMAEVGR